MTIIDRHALARAHRSLDANTRATRTAAVCLYYFLVQGSASADVRRSLRIDVFHDLSGFDCAAKKGRDYKSIWAKTSLAARLFAALPQTALLQAAGPLEDAGGAVDRLQHHLESLGMRTSDSMADYCGAASNNSRRQESAADYLTKYQGRYAETDTGHRMTVGALTLLIPYGAALEDIKKLVRQLNDYHDNQQLHEADDA